MSVVSHCIDQCGCKVNLTSSVLHWGARRRRNYRHRRVDGSSIITDAALESKPWRQAVCNNVSEIQTQFAQTLNYIWNSESTKLIFTTQLWLQPTWMRNYAQSDAHNCFRIFRITSINLWIAQEKNHFKLFFLRDLRVNVAQTIWSSQSGGSKLRFVHPSHSSKYLLESSVHQYLLPNNIFFKARTLCQRLSLDFFLVLAALKL